jgi:hypothetical protein
MLLRAEDGGEAAPDDAEAAELDLVKLAPRARASASGWNVASGFSPGDWSGCCCCKCDCGWNGCVGSKIICEGTTMQSIQRIMEITRRCGTYSGRGCGGSGTGTWVVAEAEGQVAHNERHPAHVLPLREGRNGIVQRGFPPFCRVLVSDLSLRSFQVVMPSQTRRTASRGGNSAEPFILRPSPEGSSPMRRSINSAPEGQSQIYFLNAVLSVST